jgi:hypothetical protein
VEAENDSWRPPALILARGEILELALWRRGRSAVMVMVRLSMRMRWERARASSANRARATLVTWSGVVWEMGENGGVGMN